MINSFTYLNSILENLHLLFAVTSIFLIVKSYILIKLSQDINKDRQYHSWLLLILILLGSIMSDLAWITHIVRSIWLPDFDYRIFLFILRISWGFHAIQYQAMALFLEKLIKQSTELNARQKIFTTISGLFFCFVIALAFINFNCLQNADRPTIEPLVRYCQLLYFNFVLIPSTLFFVTRKTYTTKLPRILTKQVKILLSIAIIPIWICELLQYFPIALSPTWTTNSYSAVSLSTMILTLAVYYCSKRVVALRFLNIRNHVEVPKRYTFINGFKVVLEQLSHATTNSELQHITQALFKESFEIPLNKTQLYIRRAKVNLEKNSLENANPLETNRTKMLVESFISTHQSVLHENEENTKILMYDELSFNNFYEQSANNNLLLQFLDAINADIFIPIYEKDNITAYVIVERYARLNNFYGTTERDEMLVYASYLGNVINLFQTHNLNQIVQQEKELSDELYLKHQEINQYKESMRSFLRNVKEKEIGIIFYQSRRFIFGNKAARDLVQINVNTQEGHPLTKALKNIARQVEEYKSPAISFTFDANGNKLIVSGVPNLEKNNVIITVYYPEITDIIKKQIELLNDPTKWDYLLYLETTESGKLINKLVPGTSELLLNFKINLLKTTLTKKAILLEMPEEDLMPTVEIIHHIGLREKLYRLKLLGGAKPNETAIRLFGMNPLFGVSTTEKALLEQLSESGTLFIENVEHLDLETQEYLAEFLRYGTYRPYKSEQKMASSTRIICSTNKNLQSLVHEGAFSKALFNQFKQTTVSMPSLLTMTNDEIYTLTDGFTEQALQNQTLKNILDLTDAEKARIAHARPVSLHELKNKVQHLLTTKSKKNLVEDQTPFDPAYQLADPLLAQAARLGKHSLKDPKMMALLWNKFKSQTKIAAFLGVNRSSVNRRCKDYHLTS